MWVMVVLGLIAVLEVGAFWLLFGREGLSGLVLVWAEPRDSRQ